MADRGVVEGRVALVTGGGGGIGRAVALAMAREGARIVVNDLGCRPTGDGADASMAEGVAGEIRELGGEAVAHTESISTMAGAESLVARGLEAFGRVDVLVTAAAITRVNMLWDMSEEEFDAVIDTNLKGTWTCMRAVAPHLIEQRGGRILTFSSDMSLLGGTGVGPYSASKAGVLGLTRTAALELGPYGITTNAIWPGARSRFREAGRDWHGRYPLERPPVDPSKPRLADMRPEDVAPIVVHLASDAAAHINGQVFRASSGGIARVELIGAAYEAEGAGPYTQQELADVVPRQLAAGVENPAPPQDDPVWRWMF